MSSSSDSSVSASPSPPASPAASVHGPPNLERLVVHFVSSKRSLNATSHVFQANELVTSSRTLIEEIAVLNAKNAFGRKGLQDQADILDAIRDAINSDGDKVANEFDATLADLDKAHARLEQTLSTLRQTIVNASISRRGEGESGSRHSGDQKTLYDFIDEETHEDLLSSLRSLIDSYHISRAELDASLGSLDTSLKSVAEGLNVSPEDSDEGPDKPTIYDEPSPTIPHLFHSMEDHATEMASLLENLVKHYDLCVNALKHTEGGGEAAREAVQSHSATLPKESLPGTEESLYRKTAAEPISEEERTEMLSVLENDALQVEEVIFEIRDRATELEQEYQELSKQAQRGRRRNKTLRQILSTMHSVRTAIPAYFDSASSFQQNWAEIHSSMHSKTKELAGLSVFYEQFLSGYGKLLREVERRHTSEDQMRKVAEKARREIEKLYEADRAAREEFMEDVGHFLPRDLGAWHGLEREAARWEVKETEGWDEESRPGLLDAN